MTPEERLELAELNIKRLEEALRFYADFSHYGVLKGVSERLLADRGYIARTVLNDAPTRRKDVTAWHKEFSDPVFLRKTS